MILAERHDKERHLGPQGLDKRSYHGRFTRPTANLFFPQHLEIIIFIIV